MTKTPWAVYGENSDQPLFLTMAADEEEVWRIFCGWPQPEDVDAAKKNKRAVRVKVEPLDRATPPGRG